MTFHKHVVDTLINRPPELFFGLNARAPFAVPNGYAGALVFLRFVEQQGARSAWPGLGPAIERFEAAMRTEWLPEVAGAPDMEEWRSYPHSPVVGLEALRWQRARFADENALPSQTVEAVAESTGRLELWRGAAGVLQGLVLGGNAPVGLVAREAAALEAAWLARPESEAFLGLAHGQLGIVCALLNAAIVTGEPVSQAVLSRLRGLYDAQQRAGQWQSMMPSLEGSLCNGMTGAALVAALAYQVTGDASFEALFSTHLRAAQETAVGPSICCGTGGMLLLMLVAEKLGLLPAESRDWVKARFILLLEQRKQLSSFLGFFSGYCGLAYIDFLLHHPEAPVEFPILMPAQTP